MTQNTSMHSVCRWTFHAGKGGFVPADIRPGWASSAFNSTSYIKLIREQIAPRLPKSIVLGAELHYDTEIDDSSAGAIADAMQECGIYLAMITPGAHSHYAYGGIASLDSSEWERASALGTRTVDLAYGTLKPTWHPDSSRAPTLVLWNGSYGYDLASIGVREQYQNLKRAIAALCNYEEKKGGKLYIGIEPKPNEGHPAMLIPTVASALVLWNKISKEFGVSLERKGVNKEFGHSEMIGLDHVYDTVEEIDNDAVMHVHLNSQGYNDGIILGGPGKYDIDHGCRINGMNIAVSRLLLDSGYSRWLGHDMQARAYDTEKQGVDRVIRSILSWHACEEAARGMNTTELMKLLRSRETAKAEDLIRASVMSAFRIFDELYR